MLTMYRSVGSDDGFLPGESYRRIRLRRSVTKPKTIREILVRHQARNVRSLARCVRNSSPAISCLVAVTSGCCVLWVVRFFNIFIINNILIYARH